MFKLMDHIGPGNAKEAAFVPGPNDQIELLRESESCSLFIRVILRVPSFQKGTVFIVFESSFSSTSGSVAATCDTAPCKSNLGKTPKMPTKTIRRKSWRKLPQTREKLKEFLNKNKQQTR